MGAFALCLGLPSTSSAKAPSYTIRDFTKPVMVTTSMENTKDYDLVFDARLYNSFQHIHLRGAVNICIPTTLLKRSLMTVHSLLNIVNFPPKEKALLTEKLSIKDPKPGDKVKLLFYDNSSSSLSISFTLYQTVSKFLMFDQYFEVTLLEGGLLAVSTKGNLPPPEPEFIIPEIFSPTTEPRLAYSPPLLANSLSGFVLPLASAYQTKFVNLIKKNEGNTEGLKQYHHVFRFHPELDQIKGSLPRWLKVITGDNQLALQSLYAKYSRIEELESMRLEHLAQLCLQKTSEKLFHDKKPLAVCTPLGLCPDCDPTKYEMPKGVEYGFKNRYKNIWPYEHLRVRLGCESCNSDDYFNANFIELKRVIPKSQCRYIATQNPLNSTTGDFWSLINMQNIRIIINLDSSPVQYLNLECVFSVKVLEKTADYIIRLVNDEIFHFQYLKWPDFGVPDTFELLIDFIRVKNRKMAEVYDGTERPTVVVHCMAGCGRTGVFITLDSLLDCIERDYNFFKSLTEDLVFKVVQLERTQRILMVQNFDQYIVCYEAILWYLAKCKVDDFCVPQYITVSTPGVTKVVGCQTSFMKSSAKIKPYVAAEAGDYFTMSSALH